MVAYGTRYGKGKNWLNSTFIEKHYCLFAEKVMVAFSSLVKKTRVLRVRKSGHWHK